MAEIDAQDAAEFAQSRIDPADLAEFKAGGSVGAVPSFLERVKAGPSALYTSLYENPMLGAEQRTTPHPEQYGKPISTDLYVSDAGEVSFRDPSGNIIPTEANKHVLLRGPDNRPTVYQRSEATAESPLVGGARVLSLGLGSTAPTTAAGAARLAPAAEAGIPDLKAAARSVYKDPEILARPVGLGEVATAFREIAPELQRFDPKVTARLSDTIGDLGTAQGLRIKDLDIASSRLGNIAKETQATASGPQATADAAAATIVKQKIDAVMRRVAPEFAEADKDWAAARATETIVNREAKAEVLARGGDTAARMKTQATQLLANPRHLRGLTPEEVNLVREISQGSVAGDRVRALNSWLSGKLGALGGAAAGGLLGYEHFGGLGAVGGAAAGGAIEGAISGVLTKLGNRLTANQVNTLSQSIRARSPLGQQLAQNAQEWEAARHAMHETPTSMTLTALARSSRDLSNALRSVGVEIGPAQLMRSPKAEQDEQNIPRPVGQ